MTSPHLAPPRPGRRQLTSPRTPPPLRGGVEVKQPTGNQYLAQKSGRGQ